MTGDPFTLRDQRGNLGDNARREQPAKQEDIRRVSTFIAVTGRMPASAGETVSDEIMAALTRADDSVEWREWLETGR